MQYRACDGLNGEAKKGEHAQPNLAVLFELLLHSEANYNYFAASRLPIIANLMGENPLI